MVLQIRGTAQVEKVQGVAPEYALAATRYFGADQGRAWVKQLEGMFSQMVRIAVKPERVGILDMEKRFPSAIEAAMARWTRAPFRFRISVSQLHATLSSMLVRNPGIKSAKQATYP